MPVDEFREQSLKVGRGVEISMEALILLLEARFPGFVKWEDFLGTIDVEYKEETQILGLYSSAVIKADEYEDDGSANPRRSIGEGGPIPVATIRIQDLVQDKTAD